MDVSEPKFSHKWKWLRDTAIVLLILVGLFAAWVVGGRAWYLSVRPAGPSLSEHLSQRPVPVEQRIMTVESQEYLALFGPIQSFPRFPSGYPVYVFDRSGLLTDWTPDEGDDEAFKRRWPMVFSGRIATAEEVGAWAKSGR